MNLHTRHGIGIVREVKSERTLSQRSKIYPCSGKLEKQQLIIKNLLSAILIKLTAIKQNHYLLSLMFQTIKDIQQEDKISQLKDMALILELLMLKLMGKFVLWILSRDFNFLAQFKQHHKLQTWIKNISDNTVFLENLLI